VERRAQRYTVWLPVRISEPEEGSAVTHNVSGRGLLLVSAGRLEVGAPVHLIVQFPPDSKQETKVRGHVVRVEANSEDPDGIWPHKMAIELDEHVPELEHMLALLAENGIAHVQR
jgi:PilZ domain